MQHNALLGRVTWDRYLLLDNQMPFPPKYSGSGFRNNLWTNPRVICGLSTFFQQVQFTNLDTYGF